MAAQDYEEANNFSSTVAALNPGRDGLWDFALVDNSTTAGTTCGFQAVKSDGTALTGYTVYPEVTTAGGSSTRQPRPSGSGVSPAIY